MPEVRCNNVERLDAAETLKFTVRHVGEITGMPAGFNSSRRNPAMNAGCAPESISA